MDGSREATPTKPDRDGSAAQFRALVDSSPDAILVCVRDRCVYANRAAMRLLAAPGAEDIVGLSLLDAIEALDRELVRGKMRDAAEHGSAVQIDSRWVRLDGKTVDVELSVCPVDWHGTPATQVHARDVTERKRLEKQNLERQARLDAVLDTAADAIVIIDGRGMIETVNAAAERLFGYADGELIGRNVSVLMPAPFGDEHDGYLEHFQRTREPRIIGAGREVIAKRKDGTTFPAGLSVSEIDRLNRFTGIVRDISAEKELQRHVLDAAAEEQRRIAQELHDGTQQELTGLALFSGTLLDLLGRTQTVEVGGAAARQIGAADFALLDGAARRLAQGLDEASRHVRDLAHGIMPVQIDAEGLELALSKLAARVSREQRVVCLFESSAPVRIADNSIATHLYRIAQEAVNNAVRHANASRIRIELAETDREIVLAVADDGIGFELGAGDRRKAGMGMKTMEYRAGILGGTIRISSDQASGTKVICIVPRR